MILQDAFCKSLKESMDEIYDLEEKISLCEDLAIDEQIYDGVYLNEALDSLFPVDEDISADLLAELDNG